MAAISEDLSHARLLATVEIASSGDVLLRQKGRDFHVTSPNLSSSELVEHLGQMQADRLLSQEDIDRISPLVRELASHGLVDTSVQIDGVTGIAALLKLEDYANELLYAGLYKNVFWQQLLSPTGQLPVNVLYGFAIENYHFLFRESWFDSPALCFQGSTTARLLMNEFYGEEYGHDELILKGLNAIGISREDLADTFPLTETIALCNALAYWAKHDTIFFFTTLGILEGKDIQEDSYLAACDRIGIDPNFIKPIRAHSDININGEHGSLSRMIFKAVDFVDNASLSRMRSQTRLFIELYDAFHRAIWDYYSQCPCLLRRVSDF